jgi:putative ABC transport system ATP-binding protein
VPDRNLAVENVSVAYGPKGNRTLALNKVSLSFSAGELTLVMGPSGSGKTTLLSLLGCLLTPDEGSVFVGGSEVNRFSERERTGMRRNIGFVFQAFRLFKSLPALENILVSADISGSRHQHISTAKQLLTDLGLGSKMLLKPDELSGGEKQRVAIGRAMLLNPSILLADEPTASLDAKASVEISKILQKLAVEQNRSVVVVSHDHRWDQYAHRIVVLEDGCLVEDRRNTQCQNLQPEYCSA